MADSKVNCRHESADHDHSDPDEGWDHEIPGGVADESWKLQFESSGSNTATTASSSGGMKAWKRDRIIRQQEKRNIANYLRSIHRDSLFVAEFMSRPRCVVLIRNGLALAEILRWRWHISCVGTE